MIHHSLSPLSPMYICFSVYIPRTKEFSYLTIKQCSKSGNLTLLEFYPNDFLHAFFFSESKIKARILYLVITTFLIHFNPKASVSQLSSFLHLIFEEYSQFFDRIPLKLRLSVVFSLVRCMSLWQEYHRSNVSF